MERIQKALEKARQNRHGNPQFKHTPILPPKYDFATQKPLTEQIVADEILPHQTKAIEINRQTLIKNRVVAAMDEDPRADTFKILRTKILQRMRVSQSNVLAITSPTAGAGKSLIAVNLAISIAMDSNYSVLLVDMDLRRPSVHRYFDIDPEFGLRDYFEGDKAISELLIRPNLNSLVILPAGKPLRHSSELLATAKMLNLATELKYRYSNRIVVVDLPPLLRTDDAMVFMPNVDACLLVVAEGQNSKDDVQKSLQLIDEKKYLGAVLNKSAELQSNDYYYG